MPNIAHFAINAENLPRARTFYERVFGWVFNAWGPPDFYQIQTQATGEERASSARCSTTAARSEAALLAGLLRVLPSHPVHI
jgi:predicted enzyme related to lactoylglutathione lyase